MYAIFVGTKQQFLLDSIHEEKSFVLDDGGDQLVASVMSRLCEMAAEWSKRGTYTHPQVKKPETEQLLGYAPGVGSAADVLELFKDGFFVCIARENRHGEIHLWNSRWSAFYEFGKSEPQGQLFGEDWATGEEIPVDNQQSPWYVRALGFPGTLLTWYWSGQIEFGQKLKPQLSLVRAGSPKAKLSGNYRISLEADPIARECVDKESLWSRRHLLALRKIGEIKITVRNMDKPKA